MTRPTPGVWRIRPDGNGDRPTIQAGIDAASPGDVVLLEPGAYFEHVQMKTGITLRGESGAASTILDGSDLGRVILCQNTGDVRIEGVTVQNGMGPGSVVDGGGVYADEASKPILANCVIRRNHLQDGSGAGVYCFNGTLLNCEIYDNSVRLAGRGVGVYALRSLHVSHCIIRNHLAGGDGIGHGGGIATDEGTIEDCIFEENRASDLMTAYGGALSLRTGSVRRCTFINNKAYVAYALASYAAQGGAVACHGPCEIEDCIFIGNSAVGTYSPGLGGAIACFAPGTLQVRGCTLIGNRASHSGPPNPNLPDVGGIWSANGGTVSRTIIVGGEGLGVSRSLVTECCDFFGNLPSDSLRGREIGGNFSADPMFCSTDPEATRLVAIRPESPCSPGNHPRGEPCDRIGAGAVCVTEPISKPEPTRGKRGARAL